VLDGPVTETAAAIRSGTVSATEVLELHLERVAQRNPELNAIVTLAEDRARAAAKAADQAVVERRPMSPLHGIPFVVKDIIATAGVRTTAGSKILEDHVPRRSATAIDRLERAGAILLGKSNCPEFALDLHTWNRLFGGTRNPWNPAYTSGGSSGGDSAAVAAGCSGFGVGTDYGGSIRWPAHCTGLTSLRPTVGLVPATGQIPYSGDGSLAPPNSASLQHKLQVIAPIARSVSDLWEVVRVMVGPDGYDEQCVPVALGDPWAVDLSSLTCAWFDGDGITPVDPEIVSSLEAAAGALIELGLSTVQRRPPGLDRAEEVFAALRNADGLADHVSLASNHVDDLTDGVRWWLAGANETTVSEYRRLARQRDLLRAGVLDFMVNHQILLLPAANIPAFRPSGPEFSINTSLSFRVGEAELTKFEALVCTRIISLLAVPAAVVPVGTSAEGMPLAVQVVGRPFADHEVVAVAHALERHFGRWQPSARS
ncbi:MAG: amidase, partial [Acidimicrobiaceae bacterium]|nr:amidase [Acidimicrobiaceae bacterium]